MKYILYPVKLLLVLTKVVYTILLNTNFAIFDPTLHVTTNWEKFAASYCAVRLFNINVLKKKQ